MPLGSKGRKIQSFEFKREESRKERTDFPTLCPGARVAMENHVARKFNYKHGVFLVYLHCEEFCSWCTFYFSFPLGLLPLAPCSSSCSAGSKAFRTGYDLRLLLS